MADVKDEGNVEAGLNLGRMAAAAMTFGGLLFAVVATIWGLARFWELNQLEAPTVADFVAAAVLLLGAWVVFLLLWGGAELLRKLEDVLETLRDSAGTTPGAASVARSQPGDSAAEAQARALEQLVELAREQCDIALLSEHERTLRARVESSTLARQLEHDVPLLLREHNWQEAQERVQRARARFPSVSTWETLAEQVEQARAKFEAHDLETATREVNDLSALSAWDRAADVVRDLRRRHPRSEKVSELVRRVEAGLNKAVAEERARLMSQAQEATDQRDWGEALRRVETLLEKYPKSPEALELRQQLPTLRSNAEIQHRQQMENEIRDLIKEQRFVEALRTARELIGRYPDSPQAAVLRGQLPRLEQKAGENW
ncbi:MAG: hypothetical protein KAY37_17960 [Phycisphaerae bacterium]|nr:hypothetical protein [Phycisphaerae bacterium]